MIHIRFEKPEDVLQVHAVNKAAFTRQAEADLVDTLRDVCPDEISLVAELDGQIVGYLLFTPVTIVSPEQSIQGMGLAPLAVHPDHQRQGIGSKLIRQGLKMLKARGCPFVVVLGHPDYYPRFGFIPSSAYNLKSQWKGVPDEAFMILVFDDPALQGVTGVARYRDEFDTSV